MKTSRTFTFYILSLSLPVLAASPIAFTHSRPLQPVAELQHQIGSVEFDEDLFGVANDSFSNLRVFDSSSNEIPFLIRTQKRKKTIVEEHPLTMTQGTLRTLDDNGIEVLFDNEKHRSGPFPNEIEIQTRIKNFEKQISVYGSLDGSLWEPLAEAKPIFDYSRFMNIRNIRVPLKPNRSLFYKIQVANITESQASPYTHIASDKRSGQIYSEVTRSQFRRIDFKIERVRFIEKRSRQMETTRIERLYAIKNLQIDQDPEKQITVITFDGGRVPLTLLTVLTDSDNFSRRITVEGSDGGEDPKWQTITTSTLSRIRLGNVDKDHTRIDLHSAHRYAHYRVTIGNLDSPVLEITGLEARGEVREVLFFCKPDKRYRLFYTLDEVDAPRYDIATVLAKTPWTSTDIHTFGDIEDNADFDPNPPAGPIDARTWMIIAIILVVATLVWLISKSVKQLESHPEDE